MKTTHSYMWVPCSFAAVVLAAMVAAQLTTPNVSAQSTNQNQAVQPNQQQPPVQQPNQDRVRTDQRSETTDRTSDKKLAFKASDLIGLNVRSTADKEIGEIEDLMVQEDGKVLYAAVSFGGFLGMGDKYFAVPWDSIRLVKTPDRDEPSKMTLYARINVTEQTLENKTGFDKDNWPAEGDKVLFPVERQRLGTTETTVPR
jgi:sporulation protein YlmC with PRC-barrel domain